MLRKIILYNFVCFKDKINFKFEKPEVFFFMGGNSTGKTSVFEAIRNCLKTTDFKQESSPCNPTRDLFALCYFRTKRYQIASIYIHEIASNEISKILMVSGKEEWDMQVYGARRIQNGWELFQVKLDGICQDDLVHVKKLIKEVFGNLEKDLQVNVLDLYTVIFPTLQERKIETSLFDEFIEKNVLIQMTLPHRGINPAQSTLADANQFEASSDNADVLRWYLETADDDNTETVLHTNVFRKLVNGDVYSLENRTGAIEIKMGSTGKKVPLLRLPEAVLEGHLASALLYGTASTICLEEPSRGMDRHTTKLLFDILKEIHLEEKVVIVATHDPFFISPWNLPQSYIFCGKGDECRVFNGKKLLSTGYDKINEKVKRSITSYPMSLIWFSKRVFLVEGDSDVMFVEAIRDVIVQKSNDVGRNLLERAGLQADQFFSQLQEFLSSLTIISIAGEGNKKKAEKVCDFLDMKGSHGQPVSRYFLLDHDTYDNISGTLNLGILSANPSFTELANKGVFIWNRDLEMEVASFCQAENLCNLLKGNEVPLRKVRRKIRIKKWDSDKDGKLFLESPNITEVNRLNIVSGMLSAINLDNERRRNPRKGGTVPMFLKFIIIAMLESNGQGVVLQWGTEDYFG